MVSQVRAVPTGDELRDDLAVRYHFRVSGMGAASFSRISGIKEEIEVVDHRDGNNPFQVVKVPGAHSGGEVIFERGTVLNASGLIDWFWEAKQRRAGFRRRVVVFVGGRCGGYGAKFKFVLKNAWPKSFELDALDARESDVVCHRLVLVFEEMVVQASDDPVGGIPGVSIGTNDQLFISGQAVVDGTIGQKPRL